jgi:beta-glucanase (GH16 family)
MNPAGALVIFWLLLAQAPISGPKVADDGQNDANWILTFDDEFNDSQLDLAKWVPHDPWGQVRDRQLQAFAPESVTIASGQLHLTAARTTEAKPVRYDGQARAWVSGIVTTFGTFAQMYGRFEIRCKVPVGKGLRSVFSLYPVPLGPLPRIDVFETSGNAPATISFANLWGTEKTERSFGDSFPGPDLSTGFHTLAIEWDENKIAWFIDGKLKFQSGDGVPRQPVFLLLNLAVGGGTGNILARSPDSSTRFPASFDIDYVRVYKHR